MESVNDLLQTTSLISQYPLTFCVPATSNLGAQIRHSRLGKFEQEFAITSFQFDKHNDLPFHPVGLLRVQLLRQPQPFRSQHQDLRPTLRLPVIEAHLRKALRHARPYPQSYPVTARHTMCR